MATLFPAVQPAPSEAFQAQAPRALGALTPWSELAGAARESDAYHQLMRCFPHWSRVTDALSRDALKALAQNHAVDPNSRYSWQGRFAHAEGVLRRHALAKVDPSTLPFK